MDLLSPEKMKDSVEEDEYRAIQRAWHQAEESGLKKGNYGFVKDPLQFMKYAQEQLGLTEEEIRTGTFTSNYPHFRGVENASYKLLPSLGRDKPRLNRDEPNVKITEIEHYMLGFFKRQAIPYLGTEIARYDDWDLLPIAQHYGLRTRLLDWTLLPLTALWFAVEKPLSVYAVPHNNHAQSCDDTYVDPWIPAAVWVFDFDNDDYLDKDATKTIEAYDRSFTGDRRIRMLNPHHMSTRISAQQSRFTVHPFEEDHFVALDDEPEVLENKLRKILIPRSKVPLFRNLLDLWGASYTTLMPDLDHLCKNLNWWYFPLQDEVSSHDDTPQGNEASVLPR